MNIQVRYWSWFRDLTSVEQDCYQVPDGTLLGALLEMIRQRHPRLAEVRRSTLVAVGVEYADESHPLAPSDEVSLFPPVQGG
jgi:molybdopterin synthase sulfur carrier subunit